MRVHIIKRELKNGGYSYILDYRHRGKRYREFTNILIPQGDPNTKEKLRLVEKMRAQRELDLDNESMGYVSPSKKHIDFFKYFENFNKHTSRKDPRLFTASLNKLKGFYKRPELPASLITDVFCQNFRNYLSKELNGESPHNYFSVFSRVLNEAVRDKIFPISPAREVKNKRPATNILRKEVLNDSELKSLFQTPCFNKETKRAFLFSCFTGLRSGDIRNLKWGNIDLKNKQFRFSQSKTGTHQLPPLNSTAIALLGQEGKRDEYIFKLDTQNGINKSLKSWVEKAGIKKHITFHCGRHTFATSLLVHGADLKTTSMLMGHTTTRETEKYTHISDKMKRKAVENLPQLI